MNYVIRNKTKGALLTENAVFAKSFFKRLIGYMFRDQLAPDDALIFYNAPSIHMFFMQMPLDIVFLDRENKVIRIYANLAPWRLANCLRAKVTIELPALTCQKHSLELGDVLEIKAAFKKT